MLQAGRVVYWALEYRTLILFVLKGTIRNKSLYVFLPGYLKAQFSVEDLGFLFQLPG